MKVTRSISAVFFILLLFISCQRDMDSNLPGDTMNSATSNPVKASMTGLIVDENGQALQGVIIKTGSGNTTQTDVKGYFRFNDITLDKFKSLITAEKAGYFKGLRVFCASVKGTNFVRIQLLKKVAAGTISSATGGQVTIGGYTISLPASGVIIKTSGANYSGTVSVFAQPINPTAANITDIVPGSFLGINNKDQQGLLSSYSMIAVELQGAAGESLQLAPGKTASIEFAIPSSLQSTAPASLPLWYLDETTGIWKQEGTATKTGTTYSGTVSHFSFWNCDVWEGPLILVEMTIKNLAGTPIPYAGIQVIKIPNGAMAHGAADSLGYFSGLVPVNAALQLNILNDCHSIAHTRVLSPMSQNTNLGDINIDPGMNGVSISGTVNDCNSQPVTNGMAVAHIDNKYYYLSLNSSGQFSTSVLHCQNDLEISVYDFATSQMRTYQYVVGVNPVSNLQLTTCGGGAFYTVTTYSGKQTSGFVNGPLSTAEFNNVVAACFDQAGNMYVSDNENHCIRKITPAGIVSTFAGTGVPGFADGPGATAQFKNPQGLTIDASGNIYVADFINYRIRKITPAGDVSTLAGNGTTGIANGTGANVMFLSPNSIITGPNGDMYVEDGQIGMIRKISAGVVSTFTPSTFGYVNGPLAIAKFRGNLNMVADAAGNIYVSDLANSRIRKISASDMVSTIAGNGLTGSTDGPGASATFNQPSGITLDAGGNIIVCDMTNKKIRKIDASGNVTTIAGSGTQGYNDGVGVLAQFYRPSRIVPGPNGSFYIMDVNRIRKLTP